MKASRLAFAAALAAASLVPAMAREFHNDRLDGGTGSRIQELGPSHYESRWNAMIAHQRKMTDREITAHVTVNPNGRVTKVELKGTTGNEDFDYTIRRRLRQSRYEDTTEEVAKPLVVLVRYRAT